MSMTSLEAREQVMKHFKVKYQIFFNVFFFFFPFPKLIIQEGEMSLIFQGRVQWIVVMWLIPLSETVPKS